MQKDYQHRVLICDRDDFAVMEIVEGKLVFPSEQDLQAFPQQPECNGGEKMAKKKSVEKILKKREM